MAWMANYLKIERNWSDARNGYTRDIIPLQVLGKMSASALSRFCFHLGVPLVVEGSLLR